MPAKSSPGAAANCGNMTAGQKTGDGWTIEGKCGKNKDAVEFRVARDKLNKRSCRPDGLADRGPGRLIEIALFTLKQEKMHTISCHFALIIGLYYI